MCKHLSSACLFAKGYNDMAVLSYALIAGQNLKQLIKENYGTQEDFAYDYGAEIRTISRYVNQGINKIDVIQELAEFFNVPFEYFFRNN